MGPGVGNECVETKDGPHIWEDHFLPEIIEVATGEPLPDGENGELVFTTLTKEAFPVLRYRTRGLTRLLPGTARPGMRRIEKITGRNDDMIILRGVNLFPTGPALRRGPRPAGEGADRNERGRRRRAAGVAPAERGKLKRLYDLR